MEPESVDPAAAAQSSHPGLPAAVRAAGVCVTLEGLTGIVVAVSLIVRGLAGHSEAAISNYGTAAWFLLLGAGVAAAGSALVLGRRGGYVIALMAQLLLLPVAWSLLSGSGQLAPGVFLGAVALTVLALLFLPASVHWKSAG